jgi:L-fuculose-phosphate aldolase
MPSMNTHATARPDAVTNVVTNAVSDALVKLKQDLLCAYHILDHDGQASGIAGHLSARGAGGDTFWSHRWGYTFGEMTARDLHEADFELKVLQGDGRINPTMHIHTRIYLARPDVKCIVHTHGENVLALSAAGQRIVPCTQPAALFYDDCAYFDEYEGFVLGKEEGESIAEALGQNSAVILAHHGQLVVGKTIGEAVFRAVRLEFVARVQRLAMMLGPLREMPVEATLQAQGFFTGTNNIQLQWEALRREILRLRPGILNGVEA